MSKLFQIYQGPDKPPLGPYTYRQVTEMLERGQLAYTQLATGLSVKRWTPLDEIMLLPPYDPVAEKRAEIILPNRGNTFTAATNPPEIKAYFTARPSVRFGAAVIDTVIAYIVLAAWVALLMANHHSDEDMDSPILMLFTPFPLFFICVVLSFEKLLFGESLGKLVLGLRVLDQDDQPISFTVYVVRAFIIFYTVSRAA